ncbi:unnamed protein product, partial [Rotaria sp. Silwood1]
QNATTVKKSDGQIETINIVPDKKQSAKYQPKNGCMDNLRAFFSKYNYSNIHLTKANNSCFSFEFIIASCVSPYALSSGTCVNLLLDFNNCGSVSTVCSSASYTTCTAGVCSTAPAVQLTSYTSIWTGGINGSSDDDIFNLTLPFSITVYSTTTNFVQLSTNGVICLSSCSNNWKETNLPSTSFGTVVLPYWDDLYIYAKTWQGIYYATQGTAPNRDLIFEYYTSQYGSPTRYYQFQVKFFEATPGVVEIHYYNADDTGASCTVGVQSSSSGSFLQHSFDSAGSVTVNLILTINTNTGAITTTG